MSPIKASLAATLSAISNAGKDLVVKYVSPSPVEPLGLPVPSEEPAGLEPEPQAEEGPIPEVEAFFDSEIATPVEVADEVVMPTPGEEIVRKHALRVLRASAPTPPPNLQASLSATVAAMGAFGPVFVDGVENTKVEEADTADTALKLANLTNAQQITAMEADLDAHAASNGASHALTPAQAGTYSQAQIGTKLAARPAYGSFPISRYGELSYLPIGVSGSFQGATMNFEMRRYPGIIEDDGTYVFLRNGTTGSTEGVYYAYMKNAINATAMISPTRTNFRYQPAYFPAGSTARWVTKSDGNCILGRLQTSAGALSDYFISLTNGTFDATKHNGAIIAAASFPALSTVYCNYEAIVGNTNIYLIISSDASGPTTVPVEFQIWSVPIATVRAANGGNVTFTQLTGWTTTGFGGTFSGTTNVRVANMQLNTNAASLPMVVYPASPANLSMSLFVDNNGNICTDSAQDPVTGNIRIRAMGIWFVSVPTSGYAATGDTIFWVNVNPTAKTATLEGPATAPGTLTYNSGAQTATYTGGMFNTLASNIIPQAYQGGTSTNVWTPSGYWFSITDSDPPDYGANIARAKCVGTVPTNRYAALVPTATVNSRSSVGFVPSYGTPLGGRMTGSWLLPGGYMMASSYGPRADGVTLEWAPVVCLPGAAGYTYGSQYSGTLTGYAPSTFRTRISDMGKSIDTFATMVSEVSAAGGVVASTGYFFEGFNTTGFTSVSVVGGVITGAGSISLSAAVMQAIKANCWAALGIAAPPVSSLELIVPQNTAIPPFALMTYTDASKNLFVAVFELAIAGNVRSGALATMSVVSTSGAIQTSTGTVIQGFTDSVIWTTGACHIYEGSDGYFVGWGQKTYMVIPGTGAGHMLRFAMPKSTNRPQWNTLSVSVVGISYSANFFMGYPGVGFGYCPQNPTNADNYTKITFIPTCTTMAQYAAWSAIGAQRVLVSQDVAQGWNVYFTDNQPLIMNGKFFTMPITSINLTSIKANPASTTFYVYIVITAGVPAYVIQTTDQAESATVMFVGTIITGAASITATNMAKVTRIANYRATPTRGGSSIAVSVGTPDSTAALAWK